MWSQTSLDLVETATIVSSLGTLAIAFTSWYQMHRTAQETFLPILSVDDISWDERGQLVITVKNYGNGPALDVRMEVADSAREQRQQCPPLIGGQQVTALHVGTNEHKVVTLAQIAGVFHTSKEEASERVQRNTVLRIHYTSIRHRPYTTEVVLDHFFSSTITPLVAIDT
ncbi:hypothetical protein [Alicyclobacillus acidiphilus]|uniref:hypothetical protein n=1 Tax=Alicyclobacillus acidiphilus TaxID=182455 RepID=UPI00082DC838|nr:hypothetical protein [Alicyclobacillus acidiphilus]